MSAARSDRPLGPNWEQHTDGWWYAPGQRPAEGEGAPKPPGEKQGSVLVGLVVIAAVVALVVWGCGQLAPSEEEREEDRSGVACRHFRNVAGDLADGVLTSAELRGKLQEIDRDAEVGTPAVRRAATAMLRANTAGDLSSFAEAVDDMSAACSAAGH